MLRIGVVKTRHRFTHILVGAIIAGDGAHFKRMMLKLRKAFTEAQNRSIPEMMATRLHASEPTLSQEEEGGLPRHRLGWQ